MAEISLNWSSMFSVNIIGDVDDVLRIINETGLNLAIESWVDKTDIEDSAELFGKIVAKAIEIGNPEKSEGYGVCEL